MLPYDTRIFGWVSAQMPICVYIYEVFGIKSVVAVNLATNNTRHTQQYFMSYDGLDDCQNMLHAMTEAISKNFNSFLGESSEVNLLYGENKIITGIPNVKAAENYVRNFSPRLKDLDKLVHFNANFAYSAKFRVSAFLFEVY